MKDRAQALRTARDTVRAPVALSELTPSRRDFLQYVATQRTDLAIVAVLGGPDPAATLAHAQRCDDAEVAALAVTTGPTALPLDAMRAVAAATTAALLHDAFVLDPAHLYAARLHAADAVVVPVADLDESLLQDLAAVGRSLHMSVVMEVQTEAHLAAALRCPHTIIGVRCEDARGGTDIGRTRELAARVPPQHTVLSLVEITAVSDAAALRGSCDGVLVGALLEQAPDVGAVLRTLTAA